MNNFFRVSQDLGAAACVFKSFYDNFNIPPSPSYISMGRNLDTNIRSCELNDFNLNTISNQGLGGMQLMFSTKQNIYGFNIETFILNVYQQAQIKDGKIFSYTTYGNNNYYAGWDSWKQSLNLSWSYNQYYNNFIYEKIGTTDYHRLILDQYDGYTRAIITQNMTDASSYNYIYDTSASFTLASASQGNFSCGVNSNSFPYFSQDGGSSVFGHYTEGGSYQGLAFLTNYNYAKFKVGMFYNQDNIFQFGTTDGQNYSAIKCDSTETALWMYDKFGNNLLWNSQGKGVLNLFTYVGNLGYFSVPSAGRGAGEASMWFRDFLDTNLLWNSLTDGKLQMYSQRAYSSFYIKDEASFWFSDYSNGHNIKYNSTCNLLQIWSNSAYINISTEDLRYSSGFAKFRYIRKNGKPLLDSGGNPIMILATSDIELVATSSDTDGTAFLSKII